MSKLLHLSPALMLRLRSSAALCCLVVLMALQSFGVRPDFHEHVHDDAHEEDHTCAVVLFCQGITTSSADLEVARPVERVIAVQHSRTDSATLSPQSYLQPPGRAPPAA